MTSDHDVSVTGAVEMTDSVHIPAADRPRKLSSDCSFARVPSGPISVICASPATATFTFKFWIARESVMAIVDAMFVPVTPCSGL